MHPVHAEELGKYIFFDASGVIGETFVTNMIFAKVR